MVAEGLVSANINQKLQTVEFNEDQGAQDTDLKLIEKIEQQNKRIVQLMKRTKEQD